MLLTASLTSQQQMVSYMAHVMQATTNKQIYHWQTRGRNKWPYYLSHLLNYRHLPGSIACQWQYMAAEAATRGQTN
jgi:hypothetical protein